MCMMTSLCHGKLASASALALQGVALALESVALLTSLTHAIYALQSSARNTSVYRDSQNVKCQILFYVYYASLLSAR